MRQKSYVIAAIVGGLIIGGFIGGWAVSSQSPVASDPDARPGRLVRLPDRRQINLRCMGQGAPTVVFEGGYAATSLAWYKVQPTIARQQRTCSYDRAGYGFSDPGPLPRDGAAVAKDLDDALRAADIRGPFVMVGHSAGGLYVRLFADRRPDDVVGMVLIDPTVEHQDRAMARLFGPGAGSLAPMIAKNERCLDAALRKALPSTAPGLETCTPAPKPGISAQVYAVRLSQAIRTATWRTQISELQTLLTTTSQEVEAGRPSLGAMPLVVLTAADDYVTTPQPARAAVEAVWAGLHRQIAAHSSRGSAQMVARSSHMMIFDRPDAIIAAIQEVTAAAAGPKRTGPVQ